MFAHLLRTSRTVESDAIDAEGLKGVESRTNLSAEQHRARGLDGHLREDRQLRTGLSHRMLGANYGCLSLQQILRGLHEDRVCAAVDEAEDLCLVGIAQIGVRGMTQGRKARAWTHRTEHPARLVG